MKRVPLSISVAFLLAIPCLASSDAPMPLEPKSQPEQVKALETVTGARFISRRYTYRTESGRHFVTKRVIHGVPDERPYEVAHPHLDKFHKGCQRWESSVGTLFLATGLIQKAQGKKMF